VGTDNPSQILQELKSFGGKGSHFDKAQKVGFRNRRNTENNKGQRFGFILGRNKTCKIPEFASGYFPLVPWALEQLNNGSRRRELKTETMAQ
jgi:hypothetical protein